MEERLKKMVILASIKITLMKSSLWTTETATDDYYSRSILL